MWSPRLLILLLVIFGSLMFRDFEATTRGMKAPVVGRRPFEPYFLTGLRFKRWSMCHLTEGYRKVRLHTVVHSALWLLELMKLMFYQFKDQIFKVIRLDGMVLIIPRRYVEELRSVPEHRLSLRHLQAHVRLYPSASLYYKCRLMLSMDTESLWQKHNHGCSSQE